MSKKLLVTGTTGGIGAAVKSAALACSWQVFELNRADWDIVRQKIAGWSSQGIRFDGIVFSTGTCPVKPVALLSDELFEETFKVNCGLFMRLMRTVLEERAYGSDGLRVIALSSVSATEGWPGGAAYCASKGALSALCRAMNAELTAKRISVFALEPRYVRTRMFENGAARMGVDASLAESPEDLAERIVAQLA